MRSFKCEARERGVRDRRRDTQKNNILSKTAQMPTSAIKQSLSNTSVAPPTRCAPLYAFEQVIF